MHPEPLHTRFRISPSGPAHVGHAILAWLSMHAARVTGGTFTTRLQHLWNTRARANWEKYLEYANENLDDLRRLDIEPSHADAFLAHDMSPTWRRQLTDDRALIDYFWHKTGLERLWGEWQPEMEEVECDIASMYLRWSAHGQPYHPYLRFAQLVGEIATGRTCIIRGADHTTEKDFGDYILPLIAKAHHGPAFEPWRHTPVQYFLPFIEREGGVKLSSSDLEGTAGYFVKDILEAKVPPEQLFKFAGKVLWGSVEKGEEMATAWSTEPVLKPHADDGAVAYRGTVQPGAAYVMERVVRNPVIRAEDWERLLSTHEVEEDAAQTPTVQSTALPEAEVAKRLLAAQEAEA